MQSGEEVETATIGREGALGTGVDTWVSRHATRQGPRPVAGERVAPCGRPIRRRRQPQRRGSVTSRPVTTRWVIAQIQQSVACNALHDAEARLCRWLLNCSDCVNSDTIPLTQEFLGQMLGVRRTTVTIVARMLPTAGIIRFRRGVIQIIDRAALEEGACECYATTRQHIEWLLPEKASGLSA